MAKNSEVESIKAFCNVALEFVQFPECMRLLCFVPIMCNNCESVNGL